MKRYIICILECLLLSLTSVPCLAVTEEEAWDIAVKRFPLYQEYDKVSIVYVYGTDKKTRHCEGFYKKLSKHKIQIGEQSITLTDLPDELRACFIPRLNEAMRKYAQYRHIMLPERKQEVDAIFAKAKEFAIEKLAGNTIRQAMASRDNGDVEVKWVQDDNSRRENGLREKLENFERLAEFFENAAEHCKRAVKYYDEAILLCKQAIDEGMSEAESRALDFLQEGDWATCRSIAGWLTKVDEARGDAMLKRIEQAEQEARQLKANTYYADSEALYSQGKWKEAREQAKKLEVLDKQRATELLAKINRAAGDELVELAREIVLQKAWEDAVKCCELLAEFDPERARELSDEIEQARR